MLTIFRGNDFTFDDNSRRVVVKFNTDLDLTGWSAKFSLLDNTKSTDDITSRIWVFQYTAEETMNFPLGRTFGKLSIYDANGDKRQVAKVIVDVVNFLPCPAVEGTIAISIDNLVSNYDALDNRPILNGKVIEGDHDAEYYDIQTPQGYDELVKRVGEISAIIDGDAPLPSLLFTSTGDPAHWFKLEVVMRDDGAGNMVPTIGVQTTDIPDESDSEASE